MSRSRLQVGFEYRPIGTVGSSSGYRQLLLRGKRSCVVYEVPAHSDIVVIMCERNQRIVGHSRRTLIAIRAKSLGMAGAGKVLCNSLPEAECCSRYGIFVYSSSALLSSEHGSANDKRKTMNSQRDGSKRVGTKAAVIEAYVLRVILSKYVCRVAFSSVVLLMSVVTSSTRESSAGNIACDADQQLDRLRIQRRWDIRPTSKAFLCLHDVPGNAAASV